MFDDMDLRHAIAKRLFGVADRIELYESLAIMLEGNQVLLIDALTELASIASHSGTRRHTPRSIVMHDLVLSISEGMKLSSALSRWIPSEEVSLVAAGEESGNIAQAFEDAIKIIDAKRRISEAVLKASVYPVILLGLVAAILVLIGTKAVPKLAKITDPSKWDGAAAWMYAISTGIQHYGLELLAALVIGAILIYLSLSRFRGPARVWLDRIPPWSIYRTLHGTTFLTNVALMLQSGIRLSPALQLLAEHATPWLRERIEAAQYGISSGYNLGESLQQAGHDFPDRRAVQFLTVLASRDGFEDAIVRFSARWLDQAIRTVNAFAGVAFGVGMAIVGSLVLLVLLGMFGIQDSIVSNLK